MKSFYCPPYDSPIEDLLAYNLVKYLEESARLLKQVHAKTICGNFILDFVIDSPLAGRIAIECDGKDFHDFSRDEWRDAMILGENHVDAIYRFRGCDLHYHMEDLLLLLSILDPKAISGRGHTNLCKLASEQAKAEFTDKTNYGNFGFRYRNSEDEAGEGDIRVWVCRRELKGGIRAFWQAAYAFANSIGGGDLNHVISKYREQAWNGAGL